MRDLTSLVHHVSIAEMLTDAFAGFSFSAVPRIEISPGASFPDGHGKKHPILVLALFSMSLDEAESELNQLSMIQQVAPTFRVVVFTDMDIFAIVRRYGWTVEHVMREGGWVAAGLDLPWAVHVVARAREVLTTYGALGLVVAQTDSSGKSTATSVLRVLGSDLDSRMFGNGGPVDHQSSPDGSRFSSWRSADGWGTPGNYEVDTPDGSGGLHIVAAFGEINLIVETGGAPDIDLDALRAGAVSREWGYAEIDLGVAPGKVLRQLALNAVVDAARANGVTIYLGMAEPECEPSLVTNADVVGVLNCPIGRVSIRSLEMGGYRELVADREFDWDAAALYAHVRRFAVYLEFLTGANGRGR